MAPQPRRTAKQRAESDPSYRHISKLADACVCSMSASNLLERVKAYNRAVMLHFQKGGIELLDRMRPSKALCDIVLRKHCLVDSRVRKTVDLTSVDKGDAEEAFYLIDQITDCLPPNSKTRVAPYASRRMQELREDWHARIKADREQHRIELQLVGGSLVDWDSEIG